MQNKAKIGTDWDRNDSDISSPDLVCLFILVVNKKNL